MEKVLYIKNFVKHWREVGSVTPSSRFLVRKMLAPIDFVKAKNIVELGPGAGCFTRAILRQMRPDARLSVFETNADFVLELRKISDSRLTVHHMSATEMLKHIAPASVEYVVSGIPLANLSAQDKHTLLSVSLAVLKSHGKFIQFQYSLESRRDLLRFFSQISISFTPFNVLPAFVYTCVKK